MLDLLRRLGSKRLHVILPFVALGLVFLLLPTPTAASPSTTHYISLDARQYEFTPSRIEVHQGDHVVITLTASDVAHGFYLEGYGIEQRVVPGVAQEISFTADQAGKFRFRCSLSCGAMHPFMLGELVVQTNAPFWRSLGLMMTALVGTMFYLSVVGRNNA
jgi:cytochrome c oxidase subunit 2